MWSSDWSKFFFPEWQHRKDTVAVGQADILDHSSFATLPSITPWKKHTWHHYTDSPPHPILVGRLRWEKLRSYKEQRIPESDTLLFFSPWGGTRVGPSVFTMGYVFSCFPTIDFYQLPLPSPGLYCQKPQGIILLLSYTFYPQHAKSSRDE